MIKKTYKSALVDIDNSISEIVSLAKIEFIKLQLKELKHSCDDYKERLQLSLLFLGLKESFTIHVTEAAHRARWIAKIKYSLKIYLFRSQFRLF